MAQDEHILDFDGQFVVVSSEYEARKLSAGNSEEVFSLIALESPSITARFYDYGFFSAKEKYYLYENMTVPFSIIAGSDIDIQMALFQIEEHLLAIDHTGEPIYFIAQQERELIHRFAKAYNIQIVFIST